MGEILIEKVRQRTFLYDTKSLDYRDQRMSANAGEGIGKEFKIKRKFYIITFTCDVSSRDVRIVCPRPKKHGSLVITKHSFWRHKMHWTTEVDVYSITQENYQINLFNDRLWLS